MRVFVPEKVWSMLNDGRIDKSRIIYCMAGRERNETLLGKSVKRTVWGNLTVVLALDLTNDFSQKNQMEMWITKEDVQRRTHRNAGLQCFGQWKKSWKSWPGVWLQPVVMKKWKRQFLLAVYSIGITYSRCIFCPISQG